MSCIAGLFRRNGAAIEPALIQQMLAQMAPRAPDGEQLHQLGPVALGQAFLRTGRSGAEQPNRLTLDGRVWITADARIDGRGELLDRLRSAGRQVATDAPHAELILHAYHGLGDDFLDHLIGDFAFAIWDADRQRWLCARDHFGVRPFYYFDAGPWFGFASDMAALLALPQLSRQLDRAAVADFLLLGMCLDADQTIYREIRCLEPATRMDITPSRASRHRYWELPRPIESRYGAPVQYVAQFGELFEQAVRDRLPDGPVALQLSGGMDSTAIAAVASAWSRQSAQPVTGYHVTSKSIVPEDDEEHFARLAADHLGLRLVRQDLGDYPLFSRSQEPALRTAFPLSYPHLAAYHDTLALITESGARVLLSGYAGDAVMAADSSRCPGLLRTGRPIKFVRELAHQLRHTGSLRGLGLRSLGRAKPNPPPWKPPMPDWIEPAFADPSRLAARWDAWWTRHQGAAGARDQLRSPWIQRQFESTEILQRPLVGRYPFLDLRLVQFLIDLPNFMLADKTILRQAMSGRLPETIRARPKTPAPGDYLRFMVTNGKLSPALIGAEAGLPGQVSVDRFMAAWQRYCNGDGADSTWASWLLLQPIAFGHWLSHNGKEFEK